MEHFEIEGNRVFITWVDNNVTLDEIDNQCKEYNKRIGVESVLDGYMMDICECGPNAGPNLLYIYSQPLEELKKITPPDPNNQ